MDDQSLEILFGTTEKSAELHAIRLTQELQDKIGKTNLRIYAVGSKKRLAKSETNIVVPDYFDIGGKSLFGIFESCFHWISGLFQWLWVFIKIETFVKEYGKPDLFIAVRGYTVFS